MALNNPQFMLSGTKLKANASVKQMRDKKGLQKGVREIESFE